MLPFLNILQDAEQNTGQPDRTLATLGVTHVILEAWVLHAALFRCAAIFPWRSECSLHLIMSAGYPRPHIRISFARGGLIRDHDHSKTCLRREDVK